MALARCTNCGRPDGRGGNTYSGTPHDPIGHPDSGLVCGTRDCLAPAQIWLTQDEEAEYQQGRRVLQITGGHMAAKFHVR